MELDFDFSSYLDDQTRKFKKAIMREYLKYRHNPVGKSGFPALKIASDEFYKQKHFEVIIEDCVRRYLVNGFLGRLFEVRGNGIYPPVLPESLKNAFVHVSNKEFEEIVPYEFCGDFLTNKRVLVRYTCIPINEEYVSEDIDEIIIINWEMLGHINFEDRVCRGYIAGKPVIEYSLKAFLYENSFTEEEYNTYYLVLSNVIYDAVDLVGLRTNTKLTAASLFEFRFDLEEIILNYISTWQKYKKLDDNLRKTDPKMIEDFSWAYHIILPENRKKYSELEENSKKLLFHSGALKIFRKKKYYLALIGRSDFAKCFETSEYLYRQHDSDDKIDYTSIISGYLKSVEQLLFAIVMQSIDKGCYIKKKGGAKNSKTDFTTDNLKNCDISLGPLIYFLEQNKGVLNVQSKYKEWLLNCLKTYVNECRNECFHKHNINKWCVVEFVRQNTFLMHALLLGCCRLGEKEYETDKLLRIVRDDRMERVLNWIINIPQELFYIQFWEDEKPVQVKFGRKNEFPEFDSYGFIKDYMFLLDCPELIDPVVHKPHFTFIKRDRLPDKMWYINSDGKRVDYK